jgi:hypothetical protein
LGHNQQTQWFNEHVDAFFQADGPLGMFNQVSPLVLFRHFSAASNQARALFDRRHSNDQSSAEHEDIPPWAQQFFRFFYHSKICLQHPPRLLRLGVKGAVLCLV